MKRWPWIVFFVIVVGFAGAGAYAFKRYTVWKEKGREEAIANFSALTVCLVGGPERLSVDEASEYASRLHESADDPTIGTCAQLRDKLVNSSYVRHELGDLGLIANEIDLGPFTTRPSWDLTRLFLVTADLPWNPPTHIDGKPIPKLMVVAINSQLEAMKYAPHTFIPKDLNTRIDPYLPNQVTVAEDGQFDVVIADTPEMRLSRAVRFERPKPRPTVPSNPEEAKEAPAVWLENTFFWVEGDRFYMRQPHEKKAAVVKLPANSHASRIHSCRAPNRRIFGLELQGSDRVALYAFQNQTLVPAGIADLSAKTPSPSWARGFRSSWTMSCEDDVIRIAWAVAEPSGPAKPDARGDMTPPPGGFQNIRVETCSQGICTRKETRIALDVGRAGSTGFGSQDWTLMAPETYSLGNSILLIWREEFAFRYRFAPIEELPNARNEFFAQLNGAPGIHDAARTTSAPQLRTLTRGNVALTSAIIEETGRRYLIVVRFDADGKVEALPIVNKSLLAPL